MSSGTASFNETIHINEEYVKTILSKYNHCNEESVIEDCSVHKASDKMLGFLCEYWKVKVHLSNRKVLYFFIKALSRTNEAKAKMVKEMKLFDKEVLFYNDIKKIMELPDINLKPWSANIVAALDDALVFEDLNAKNYKLRNKFERFNMEHTLQALNTLARFHACSIIYEEKRSRETQRMFRLNEEFKQVMDKGGYQMTSGWYLQCMTGALEAIKTCTKYSKQEMLLIENRWLDMWDSALCLNDPPSKTRNVICHRDLWNNNIMFHYADRLVPDDCLFVDFQAMRYQPPASDFMLLLCCNLDPKFREENLQMFLDYYYDELGKILFNNGIEIDDILKKQEFVMSAEEQRQFGLVLCACLMPQFWIDDDMTTKIFSNNVEFNEILSKNKGFFIKEMMESNSDYKDKVMEIFVEIADTYCLNKQDHIELTK